MQTVDFTPKLWLLQRLQPDPRVSPAAGAFQGGQMCCVYSGNTNFGTCGREGERSEVADVHVGDVAN